MQKLERDSPFENIQLITAKGKWHRQQPATVTEGSSGAQPPG